MQPSTLASPAPVTTGARWSLHLWGLLFVLAGNMLIDALEVSAAVVALPAVGTDLGLPLSTLQWVMTGFAIGFGGLMLLGNRAVALLGRRRVYLVALIVFAAASVAGGLTGDPGILIATRFVKGGCAALTAPTGLAIISTAFADGPDRKRAISVYTLFGASGFTVGLLLSGLLTELSWRWTFLAPAPVVLVLFGFAVRLIPADGPTGPGPRRFDLAGAVAFAGALPALVYGIVSVPGHGWDTPQTLGAFGLTVVLAVAFVAVERTTSQPLFRPGPGQGPGPAVGGPLIRSALGAAALNGSYLGLLLIVTLRQQTAQGWTPLQTALAILPASVPLAVTALLSGRMVSRYGAQRLIALGAATPVLGYLLCLRGPADYLTGILPTMVLVGAGFVLAFAALNLQATAAVPAPVRGVAGALYQTAVQLGAALVLALVSALLLAYQAPQGAAPDAVRAAERPALWLVTGVGAVGLFVALVGALRPSATPRPEVN